MTTELMIRLDDSLMLSGHYSAPPHVKGWVLFVHGSGSSRFSPRNNYVAHKLNKNGYGTVLFDLLTEEEDRDYKKRFDIGLLSWRLQAVTDWFMKSPYYKGEPLAYFGASTGAAAAIVACGSEHRLCSAFTIISRGGRPDLSGVEKLRRVHIPVLLLVGSLDKEVIRLNKLAARELSASHLVLVKGASHLFEEPGTLDEVIHLSTDWLNQHLPFSENYLNDLM